MKSWIIGHQSRHQDSSPLTLKGRRVTLRPLSYLDYEQWNEVRTRCHSWLTRWEPRLPNGPHVDVSELAFKARVNSIERDRELGTGFGFGIFYESHFVGEVNLSSIMRGAFQSGTVGYWIDKKVAGNGFMPESVALILKFAFEILNLHRVEIAIVPRNTASTRVVEKLRLRFEGLSERFLLIDGVWEDHNRFAILSDEWLERRQEIEDEFIEST